MAKNAKKTVSGYVYIRIAAVLLCLILASTYLIIGLFARYNSESHAEEGARVAKFSIRGKGQLTQSIVAEVIPGEPASRSLEIDNDSEVAVKYTITVTNETNNLPLKFNVIVDPNATDSAGTPVMSPVEGTDNTFTATQSAGSHSDKYILEISWPQSADPEEDIARIGMVDYITVTVTAEQVD